MEVATGALPSLLAKLSDLLISEYNLQKEVKGGIIFLQAELESMKVALEKISDTPPDKLDKQDKIWARDVRELSYDIEDKIDTFTVRCQDKKLAKQHGLKKIVDRSLNWLVQPKVRHRIATDIRVIKIHVQEVSQRRDRYKINSESSDKPIIVDPRLLAQYMKTTELVGIDAVREELIQRMMMEGNQVSKKQANIVSIVGFGGLGKTTLANVVYEDLRAKFDCSAFVLVSQTPDMEKLLNNLLYQLDKRNIANINNVINEIRGFLQNKRYFIVIDDIWDISVWKTIRCAMPDNNSGSKIITTTRILKVAEEVGGAYKMKPLCLRSSRILLQRRIFGDEYKDTCPTEELAEVSDRILMKCAGVPLAIITIASLLAGKGRNKLDWYDVYNSIGTGMEDSLDVENMRKILSFSYYNMPSHLRTCLLYLSIFPEDYEVEKNRLIWMWITEGFIQRGKQGHSPFEVGESYFNELVNRSMIQPVYGYNGMKILSCRVHDMVLDLLRYLSSEENFITSLNDVGRTSPLQKVRRLSLQNDMVDEHEATKMSMQQARSVVVFSSAANLIPALSRFEVVRMLHLENCDLSQGYDLKYIGKLVHLRCLGLCSTKIAQLPEEIGNLKFLQMLDIWDNEISTLPSTIVQLKQLKCLYMDIDIAASNIIGRLTSLEELSPLYIRTNATELLKELGHLTELRTLHIAFLGPDRPTNVLVVECLHKLQKIESLYINVQEGIGSMEGWEVGSRHLRSLQVDGYWFLKLPVWINHSYVQNLSFLKISRAELQPEDLEILGRLPTLRWLHMYLSKRRFSGAFRDEDDFFRNVKPREFAIGAGSFPCLLHCKLPGHYERVVFRQGAMPRLASLELHVYMAVWSAWTQVPDLGFENLPSLMHLHVGLLRAGREGSSGLEKARTALKAMAETHPNHPSILARSK